MTAVIGGGISGLSAAYYILRRFGRPVDLYESSNRIGGWIRTERHNDRGFIFEFGPRTLRPKGVAGANTLQLLEELELPLHTISSKHAAARNRMIYANGQLCMLPNSLGGIFRTLPPFKKPLIGALFKDLVAKRKISKIADESIYSFVERRFGSDIANYAISPLICGICAGDAKEISVRFLMEDFFEKEQQWGGVTKGIICSKFTKSNKQSKIDGGIFGNGRDTWPAMYKKAQRERWSMYSVQNGLETLPRSLGKYLRDNDVNIQLSAECTNMTFKPEGVNMRIKGQEIIAQNVISSMPAYKLAPCVKEHHPSLAAHLLNIPYVDVAVVNLQYAKEDLLRMKAFGFLVPPVEGLPVLGVIFDSCCFDMHGNTVLTVMMGGRWFDQNFGTNPSQKEMLDTALQYVDGILGIDQQPRMSRVNVLRKCIPQYTVGHKQRIEDIRRYIAHYKLPLFLCGAAYDGVGINDVILSARQQVDHLPA